MHGENISYAYGFWRFVVVSAGMFAFFLLSYPAPYKKREQRGNEGSA